MSAPVASRDVDDDALEPLVEQAQSGYVDAFEEIVHRLRGPVRSYANRLMRDAYLGDDATQETFFRVWKGLPRYERRGKFTAWMFAVTRNTCIELLGREARAPRPAEYLDLGSFDPYENLDLALVMRDAIEGLSKQHRLVLLLRETGMEHKEMAEVFGCPVATVRTRLHRARMRLATQVVADVDAESPSR